VEGYSNADARIKRCRYKIAEAHYSAKEWEKAIPLYEMLGNYSSSESHLKTSRYNQMKLDMELATMEGYDKVIVAATVLDGYKDSEDYLEKAQYAKAKLLLAAGDISGARELFASLGKYSDAATQVKACDYAAAEKALAEDRLEDAAGMFLALGNYEDAAQRAAGVYYLMGVRLADEGKKLEAARQFEKAGTYEGASEHAMSIYDEYYAETAVAAQDAYDNGYYEMCITLLSELDRTAVPAKYAYVNDLYDDACFAEAERLYDAGLPFEALPYYRLIPTYPKVDVRLERDCYMFLGAWRDLQDNLYLFREDGTCSLAGQEAFFNIADDHLLTGETADALQVTHRFSGVTKRNIWLYDQRTGEEITVYLTKDNNYRQE